MDSLPTRRAWAIRRAEQWLQNHDVPRLKMALIVALTGLAAALFSFLLLQAGLTAMWARYPLAVSGSYLVFLLLLRVWLSHQAERDSPVTSDGSGALDLLDIPVDVVSSGGRSSAHLPDLSDTVGEAGMGALDLEELTLVLIALLAVGAGVLVCIWVVWTAPVLLAEILVDGVVMAGLYRRMKRTNPDSWWKGALRRTWFPALAVAVFFGLAGLALQGMAPGAQSIGRVVEQFAARKGK